MGLDYQLIGNMLALIVASLVQYLVSACKMVMWSPSQTDGYSGFLPHEDHMITNIDVKDNDLYKL